MFNYCRNPKKKLSVSIVMPLMVGKKIEEKGNTFHDMEIEYLAVIDKLGYDRKFEN